VTEDTPESSEEALALRLASLDGELDRLRRRIWRIDKGLEVVGDRERELDDLSRRSRETSDEFVRVYRSWQQAAGE
jgi:hypothetical protein